MVIVQTPLRISFFGGGTDYPTWFQEHGGNVLATSIDKYIYTSCRELSPFFNDHLHRIIYSKMEFVKSVDEIVHPAVREIFRYMKIDHGIEMHHDSDLPARSGMGSSSSFVVSLLQALYALKGQVIDKETLAKESIHVEQNLLKENVGCQDQVMAAMGGLNIVNFKTNGTFTVQPLTLKPQRIQELQSHLMLFYTGTQRVASLVAAEQIKNIPDRKSELQAMQQMVPEGLGLLQGSSPITEFGRLLHEGWQLKRRMSSKISNSDIDNIYSTGLAAGALGGKLLGAGGGGFVLLFVPPEKQAQVAEKLKPLLHVKFQFEYVGSNIIFYRQQAA